MTKDYTGNSIPANCIIGNGFAGGRIEFHKNSMVFRSDFASDIEQKMEIDYSEIVWITKKKSMGIIPNRMVICTREKGEYTFVVVQRDAVIEFLDSKTEYISEQPKSSKERLRDVVGERIRRQYFNAFIYIMLVMTGPLCLFLPLITAISEGYGVDIYVLKEMVRYLAIVIVLLMPIIALSMMNRLLFGKIICVFDDKGIHYEHGFISWSKISCIEYEIDLPSKTRIHYCFARIMGQEIDVKMMQAPYYFVRKAKKYNKKIQIKFSKQSIFWMVFWCVMEIAIIITVLILKL